MSSRRAHFRRVLATAVILPLLVLATAFAHDRVRCKDTGQIVAACACPDAHPAPSTPSDPALGTQDCCERQVFEAMAARYQEGPAMALPAPVRVETRVEPLPRPTIDRGLWRLAAHRPKGRALVLLKQSFLI